MDIYEALKKYYGFTTFRKGQGTIIKHILAGRDTFNIMPTGAGKSLCYQLPAVLMPGITLVISPLISLMQDQVRSLLARGIRGAYLNSSLTPRQLEKATENACNGMYKIIYAAPERLLSPTFMRFAVNSRISLIAVDEAHCISRWGHGFRPSYRKIPEFLNQLPLRPPVAAFTATATENVRQDIVRLIELKRPALTSTGFDRENLYFGVYAADNRARYVLDYVKKAGNQSGIIYCMSRKRVDELALLLQRNGISALPYHAGMEDEIRKRNQEDFTYDRAKVIVATSAFGMGIDKPDVRYVIHYNMPMDIEDYYQQAGRAGRDGEKSECILLYESKDYRICRDMIEKSAEEAEDDSPQFQKYVKMKRSRLHLMMRYATSKECLRKRLLNYFGESYGEDCGFCSVCQGKNPVVEYDQVRKEICLSKENEQLYEKLKAHRAKTAYMASVPSYAVLSDASLRELAEKRPKTPEEMKKIQGVGDIKTERYGRGFLRVIKSFEDQHRTV